MLKNYIFVYLFIFLSQSSQSKSQFSLRSLQQQQSSSNSSVEQTQEEVPVTSYVYESQQVNFQQVKMVGDVYATFNFTNPSQNGSYFMHKELQVWYLIPFGYVVILILIINYFIKTFFTQKHLDADHGQMIPHYLMLMIPCLVLSPPTVQMLSFGYGFMALSFPWMNYLIGEMFGDPNDNIPQTMKIFFVNLNIASTYGVALAVSVFLLIICYSIIAICSSNSEKKSLYTQLFLNYLYNLFSFGTIFSSMLCLQGCFMKGFKQLFQFKNLTNTIFYLLGMIVFLFMIGDLVHSLYKHTNKHFYKLRNLMKTILLSLSHYNLTYFFIVMIVLDVFFTVGQYFIAKKDDKKAFVKIWIAKNINLNISLILLFFYSDKFISIMIAMGFVTLSVILEISQNCKTSKNQQKSGNKSSRRTKYSKAANQTIVTAQNQKSFDYKRRKQQLWTIDLENIKEQTLGQNTNIGFNQRPRQRQDRKQTQRVVISYENGLQMSKSIQYEPRRRRQRKRSRIFQNSNDISQINQSNENILQIRKSNRYNLEKGVQKLSDYS